MSENNGSTGNKKFLKGTLILTASSMVVKVIGSVNWIILSRILGGEGIGLYQMGFPIYLMAITVSSAGIPVAISIITAEKVAENDFFGAKRVFNVSLRLLFISGLVFSSALWFGAGWLIENHWIRDARAYYSIIALAPAVFFVTFLASFRGYLQGWQIMMPTAASEVVEQLMRVVTMIVFAYMFMPYGLEYAAGGASMGAGVGAFCALLVLIIGIVSFIMSMRCLAPGTTSRWVIIWLAIVVVFSLGTMDLIGLALYSITLVIYLARNKAIAAQQDVIRTWARTHQG